MRLRVEAAFDVLLGFALVYLIFGGIVGSAYLFVMIIAAQLPDWLETPSSKFGLKIPPFSWIEWLGHKLQNRMQLPWGLVTQIVVVGLIVALAISKSNIPNQISGLI